MELASGSSHDSGKLGLTCLSGSISVSTGAPTVSIFLQPPGVIPLGGSTTICCRCLCHGGKMVLYKDGYQLRTLELHGNTAEFSISKATQMDRGLYSCHYVDGGNGTVLTCSDSMEVRVEGEGCAVVVPGPFRWFQTPHGHTGAQRATSLST